MPRVRRRKIEVPTDTKPQFELGNTAKEIKRRRRERVERQEQGEREREALERERTERTEQTEETEGRGEKSDLEWTLIEIQNVLNPGRRRGK